MASEVLNLWETILRESSKRTRLPEGTVIFFGNSSCEKDKLLEKFCVVDSKAEIGRAKTEILSYDFFHALDSSDDGPVDVESVTRVSLWSLSNQVFKDALELVLDPSKIERLVFMIGIDLSKPDTCCDDLRMWLNIAKKDIDAYLSKLNPDTRADQEELAEGMTSSSEYSDGNISESQQSAKSKINFGVPVIVVGCKSESLQMVDDVAAMKRAKDLQGELRCLCLEVGAGLLYVSTDKDVQCTRLHKYLLHGLYPETFPMDLVVEDGICDVFIPAGLDSIHLISIGTGVSASNLSPLDLDTPFVATNKTVTTVPAELPAGESPVELEDEQTWLTSLQTFMDYVMAPPVLKTAGSELNVKSVVPPEVRKTPRAGPPRPSASGDPSNLHTDDLKNFFENLLTNNNPPPAKR